MVIDRNTIERWNELRMDEYVDSLNEPEKLEESDDDHFGELD